MHFKKDLLYFEMASLDGSVMGKNRQMLVKVLYKFLTKTLIVKHRQMIMRYDKQMKRGDRYLTLLITDFMD